MEVQHRQESGKEFLGGVIGYANAGSGPCMSGEDVQVGTVLLAQMTPCFDLQWGILCWKTLDNFIKYFDFILKIIMWKSLPVLLLFQGHICFFFRLKVWMTRMPRSWMSSFRLGKYELCCEIPPAPVGCLHYSLKYRTGNICLSLSLMPPELLCSLSDLSTPCLAWTHPPPKIPAGQSPATL